jgi:Domain of unknown function (DUF5069)
MEWNETFEQLFESCAAQHRMGNFDYETGYSASELAFLISIGCKPREFFDFVEDFVGEGTPAPSTALLVAAARRDYFLVVQKGQASTHEITHDELPNFGEELGGMKYLPRILKKARAKLRGELDPDMMYGCGGDRNFLNKNGQIHPADFLRAVWACGEDDAKLAAWVKAQ